MRLHVDPALLTRLHAELQRRSIDMLLVETKDEARDAVLGLIPRGATIMAGSSLTLARRRASDAARFLNRGDRARPVPTTVSVTTTTAILPSASAGKSSSSRKRMCQ